MIIKETPEYSEDIIPWDTYVDVRLFSSRPLSVSDLEKLLKRDLKNFRCVQLIQKELFGKVTFYFANNNIQDIYLYTDCTVFYKTKNEPKSLYTFSNQLRDSLADVLGETPEYVDIDIETKYGTTKGYEPSLDCKFRLYRTEEGLLAVDTYEAIYEYIETVVCKPSRTTIND